MLVMTLKAVVLPAPFGPMMLTISPSSTSEAQVGHGQQPAEAALELVHLEQRCHQRPPSRAAAGCLGAGPGAGAGEAEQALGPEQHHQQQEHAIDRLAIIGGKAQHLRQCGEEGAAQDRAGILPRPPKTTIARMPIDSIGPKLSGLMKLTK